MDAPALSERDLAILRSFASRVDPADAGAHNNLGVLYFRKGLIPEAIAQLSQALELDPKMRVAQDNLRMAYHGTGYYDRRVTELREHLQMAIGVELSTVPPYLYAMYSIVDQTSDAALLIRSVVAEEMLF